MHVRLGIVPSFESDAVTRLQSQSAFRLPMIEEESSEVSTPPQEPLEYLTKNQLAARLGVSLLTIDNLMARHRLPYVRLSRKLIRFPKAEVDHYIASNLTIRAAGRSRGGN